MRQNLHVMVGVLRDRDGRILINQRPVGKSQAGRWEFPGGKLEPGESPEAGLRRELHEELGVVAGPMQSLLVVRHQYTDISVVLDVREIAHFGGVPRSREQQALKWVAAEDLPDEDILEADRAIVQALRLPDRLLITPDPRTSESFLSTLERALDAGIRCVQFRANSLNRDHYLALGEKVLAACRGRARVLLNSDTDILAALPADGIHLNGARLREHARIGRPLPAEQWLSASCHNAFELALAHRAGVDFAMLGPVRVTRSHPEVQPTGWAGFRSMAVGAPFPVFALGGMRMQDADQARRNGARGIAAIRGLWPGLI